MDFPYYLIAFDSNTIAMELRQELERLGVAHVVMPTPRTVTKSCGLSIRFDSQDYPCVEKAIEAVAESPSLYAFYRASGDPRKPDFVSL